MTDEDDANDFHLLNTVTLFDEDYFGSGQDFHIPRERLRLFSQSSLLIESLVEYICTLVEKDLIRQKKLYRTVCQKLHELQLIDQSYLINDFDFIRNSYQKEFFRLLTAAKSVSPVIQRCSTPTPVIPMRNSVGKCTKLFEWSRYSNEYHELEFIARGGFGEVVKVQNKLDAGIYAIKKICLRYCSINGFIRGLSEVQMLAKLDHPNIVSYKAAWLEPLRKTPRLPRKSRKALCDIEKSDSKKDNGSSDIIFVEPDQSKTAEKSSDNGKSTSYSDSLPDVTDENCSNVVVGSENTSRDIFENDIPYLNEPSHQNNHECGQDWAILFIQMQLCHLTLRQWLDLRNIQRSAIDIEESLNIFSNIVRGVEFIHSKRIVHHDIKPSNIFISKDSREVQVGDFGLSCCLLHDACPDTPAINIFSSPNCPVSGTHQPGEIGTKLYAAPEQLNGICDFKSDLYSLGILIFELVYSFHTIMERVEKINNLRENAVLPQNVETEFPQIARLIKRLVHPDMDQRPTATELLNEINSMRETRNGSDESNNPTIRELRQELLMKNQEIADLKRKISLLQLAGED